MSITSTSLPTPPSAPLWRRFAALVYDVFLLGAISMAYGAIVTAIAAAMGTDKTHDYEPMFAAGGVGELVMLGWVLSLAAFYVLSWHYRGQTVGMKAWRLQVTDSTIPTSHPSLLRSAQRAAWGLLSFWFLGIGYWYRFIDPEQRCLHDKLSQTRVIVTPKKASP